MTTPQVETRRFTRVEYERLAEIGFFNPDERLELIDGLLVLREPQNSPHATATRLVEIALSRAFGAGWDVRPQLPVALDDASEPEPDVSVVPGSPRDYAATHPARPVLVVEVSDTSLAFDREYKSSLYAHAGVSDFWIVNLVDRVLEIRRDPAPARTAPYGSAYRALTILGSGDMVSPLAAPPAIVAVADLLP